MASSTVSEIVNVCTVVLLTLSGLIRWVQMPVGKAVTLPCQGLARPRREAIRQHSDCGIERDAVNSAMMRFQDKRTGRIRKYLNGSCPKRTRTLWHVRTWHSKCVSHELVATACQMNQQGSEPANAGFSACLLSAAAQGRDRSGWLSHCCYHS